MDLAAAFVSSLLLLAIFGAPWLLCTYVGGYGYVIWLLISIAVVAAIVIGIALLMWLRRRSQRRKEGRIADRRMEDISDMAL